jgi:IS5 family transposase
MAKLSFSDAEHAAKRERTRREVFLAQMNQVMSWSALPS